MYECICGVHETVSQFISDYHSILKVPTYVYRNYRTYLKSISISNLIEKKNILFKFISSQSSNTLNSFSRLIKFEVRMKNKAEMKETGRSEMKKQE